MLIYQASIEKFIYDVRENTASEIVQQKFKWIHNINETFIGTKSIIALN
jgi:hypothetical protein